MLKFLTGNIYVELSERFSFLNEMQLLFLLIMLKHFRVQILLHPQIKSSILKSNSYEALTGDII